MDRRSNVAANERLDLVIRSPYQTLDFKLGCRRTGFVARQRDGPTLGILTSGLGKIITRLNG
jgi:hypothetical protein